MTASSTATSPDEVDGATGGVLEDELDGATGGALDLEVPGRVRNPVTPTAFSPRLPTYRPCGVPTLRIEFSRSDERQVSVSTDGETIQVSIAGETCELSRADAADLQEAIGDALTEKREFFRTAGEYREDGSYVVSRRGADSAGNAKVFDSFDALRRLVGRLPAEFTADDVGRTGITGSRRHMVVRHVCEHPAFDCDITSRNPLTARKTDPEPEPGDPEPAADTADAVTEIDRTDGEVAAD